MIGKKDETLEVLKDNIASVLTLDDENSTETIDSELKKLQIELLKKANAHEDYDKITEEIERLRDEKDMLLLNKAENEGLKMKISEMQEFLDKQNQKTKEYDEELVRRMVERITVYEEYFTIEFKSGVSIEILR
jgi:superfamily I DNA/RNA helicase